MTDYFLLGLLGHPLSHSLSPVLHTAALQFAGLKGEYRLFDVSPEIFTKGVKDMLDLGVRGFNVTIPYKQNLNNLITTQTTEAFLAGAVNTIRVEQSGQLAGHNTDAIGFKLAFEEAFSISLKNKTVLIIGAGGAARAVVVALAELGVDRIKIKARDTDKGRLFVAQMRTSLMEILNSKKNGESQTTILSEDDGNNLEIDLVVNASPLGLKNEQAPQWLKAFIENLNGHCLCFDLVYGHNGFKPMFTQLAFSKGLKACDGLSMLIHQARFAFEYWTGVNVPAKVMYEALAA